MELIAVAAVAAPAQATVVDKGRFAEGPCGFAYDCGLPVAVAGEATGDFRMRVGKGHDASAFFSLTPLSYHEIHTNPVTSEWVSIGGSTCRRGCCADPRLRADDARRLATS